MNRSILKLFYSFILCFGAAFVGGYLVDVSVNDWYPKLNQPYLTPPNWVFSPVWGVLYFLMALSLWVIWVSPNRTKKALVCFFIQLVLNVTWSGAFFALKSPLLGIINILLLWVFILFTMVYFYRISKVATWLIIPYFIWVTFAMYLNFAFYKLN